MKKQVSQVPAEDTYDTRYDDAQQAAEAAASRTPGPATWGFFAYGDAPAAMGGGVGVFTWFPSKKAMFEFVSRHIAFFPPGPSEADHDAVAAEAARIVDQVVKGKLSMDAGMARLNVALRRFSQFRWWGQFKDLAKGDGDFERKIRAWARERWGEDETDSSPIRAREMAEFKDALTQYGF